MDAVADLGFWSSVHMTDRIKRTKRTLEKCGMWGTCPPRKCSILDHLRPFLVLFWGETAIVG